MGVLDEKSFEAAVAACPACGGRELVIESYLDRKVMMMVGEASDAGRWVYDGEKFVDGVFRVACASCAHQVFASDACPRCNAEGTLPATRATMTRLAVPKKCPGCGEFELMSLAMVPARAHYSGGRAAPPKPLCEHGEPGFHVVAFACESCDAATVSKVCALCDAPGPLRPRP